MVNSSKGPLYFDMKFSHIIRSNDNLENFYNSPDIYENFVSTIVINNDYPDDDEVVGINCFDEILFRSELISFARDNF